MPHALHPTDLGAPRRLPDTSFNLALPLRTVREHLDAMTSTEVGATRLHQTVIPLLESVFDE